MQPDCLEAIQALHFPRDRFEVIVVDDGSPTPPADVVASLDRSLDARLVSTRHAGPASARNTGARLARGRFLAFTDDDCMPHADWLRSIDRWTSSRSGPLAIGGHTVNVLTDSVYSEASQGIIDYLYEYFGEHPTPRRFFTSNNLVVPREDFVEIGGFDDTFALAAAEDHNDLSVLHRLLATLGMPYEAGADLVMYQEPSPDDCSYRTFCGP